MSPFQHTAPPGWPRVLVVDNDPDIRQLFVRLLAYWGFLPVEAKGFGNQLIEDAKQKSRRHRCQLALVDMRLRFDEDLNDNSGLDLVPLLKPTESIVVSNFGDYRVAVKSINEKGALSFVGKQDGPELLKDEVEKALAHLCFSRRKLQIVPQSILSHVTGLLLDDIPDAPRDEVEEVLARLFPQARALEIELLDQSLTPVTLSAVPRRNSVILKVREDGDQPVIVKLSHTGKISQEMDHYTEFIRGKLVGMFTPVLMNSVALWDLGGAVYTFLGTTDIKTFSKYYESRPAETIQVSLEMFFGQVWSNLYRETRSQSHCSLFDAYCKVWGPKWYQRVSNFQGPDPRQMMSGEIWQRVNAPEPVPWLIQKVGRDEALFAHSFLDDVVLGITHGDLHGDNLLIDDRDNAWVIDFERSGSGPILQDFVELEADIINRLTSLGETFKTFYTLCLWVAKHEHIQGFDDLSSDMDPQLLKALRVISTLRELACRLTGVTDARQYLLGLLFNTLFRATIMKRDDEVQSQRRALMLASILCHRLEHWGQPWPPPGWPAFMLHT